MKIIVKDNQTIYDIALQYAGSLEAVIDILEANGKTDTTLLIGEELEIPSVVKNKIVEFFFSSLTTVATLRTPVINGEYNRVFSERVFSERVFS